MNKAQVQKIRAIGLTVVDAVRSRDFYTQALGFEFVSDITVVGQDYSDLEGVSEAKIRILILPTTTTTSLRSVV